MRDQDKNRCIRSCRDAYQIDRCRDLIEGIESSLLMESKVYNMLGNPVRLKILYLLKQESRLCVCDISEILDMTIPSISQHLKKLRGENIVFTERDGNTIYNRLRPAYDALLKAGTANNTLQMNMAYET